jgi:hypothetical protein
MPPTNRHRHRSAAAHGGSLVWFGATALALTLTLTAAPVLASRANSARRDFQLSAKDAAAIGKKVWINECSGSIAGLTSWNQGEEFPSLGIGHFIWYPQGYRGPFDESFPRLLAYLQKQGVKLPSWLAANDAAPWSSREQFIQELNSARTVELRQFLAGTVAQQTEFIVERLKAALPKMLQAAPPADRAAVERRFNRVLGSGKAGTFALIDYVNFKGEGVVETERYNGQGWGLLQVLQGMRDSKDAVADFAGAAKRALAQRVQNSPPQRHEERWLPGWNKRIDRYLNP